MPSVLEICGGAGGQALGLEQAGFEHLAIAEIDPDACAALRRNRPGWKVIEGDIRELDGAQWRGQADLLAGGVPCQPFSVGGQQLGADDERDLFPEALRLTGEVRPRAVLLENVPGLAQDRFASYREGVLDALAIMGYQCWWREIRAIDHGVPQLRPRFVLVALRRPAPQEFTWPAREPTIMTLGPALADLMAAGGWEHAGLWAERTTGSIPPTLVGGSKKHGGPDLGPTRAREAWLRLGINGGSIANEPPGPGTQLPRLTLRMCARIQGFPDEWEFCGGKTSQYRQIGNAFPPPVARALGTAIRKVTGL